jgi:hypothetical protein
MLDEYEHYTPSSISYFCHSDVRKNLLPLVGN